MRLLICISFFLLQAHANAQADNEIQVYASPTVQKNWTIFELLSNYTFKGSEFLSDPKSANWTNETLEITHGVGQNFELGFYTFTGIAPGGGYQYLGNLIASAHAPAVNRLLTLAPVRTDGTVPRDHQAPVDHVFVRHFQLELPGAVRLSPAAGRPPG